MTFALDIASVTFDFDIIYLHYYRFDSIYYFVKRICFAYNLFLLNSIQVQTMRIEKKEKTKRKGEEGRYYIMKYDSHFCEG